MVLIEVLRKTDLKTTPEVLMMFMVWLKLILRLKIQQIYRQKNTRDTIHIKYKLKYSMLEIIGLHTIIRNE